MRRYSPYAIAVVLLVALVWIGCGENQRPVGSDSEQQPQAAAKPAVKKRTLSVKRVKTPKTIVRSDGSVMEKVVTVFYKSGEGSEGNISEAGKGSEKCFALFAKGARWKTAEPYVLDLTNGDGLPRG